MTISMDDLKAHRADQDQEYAVLTWFGQHHVVSVDTTGRLGDLKVRMLGITLPPSPAVRGIIEQMQTIDLSEQTATREICIVLEQISPENQPQK